MRRESFTVIFHSHCNVDRDSIAIARHILEWWKPDVSTIERTIMMQRWVESLRPMFRQCQRDGTDMEIYVSMHGADPSLRIVRVFKPDLLPKKPT